MTINSNPEGNFVFIVIGFYPCINVPDDMPTQGKVLAPEIWTQFSYIHIFCLCHHSDMF